jgi:anti-anti-sigma factor
MTYRLFDRPRGPTADLAGIGAFTVTITHPATGVTLVDLVGALDLWTRPTLDEHLERELRDRHHQRLVVNLNHLIFCGAAGCASLPRARELAYEQRTSLYVVRPLVGRLLQPTELHNQFRTYPDLTSALAAVSREARAAAFLARVPAPVSAHPEPAATYEVR